MGAAEACALIPPGAAIVGAGPAKPALVCHTSVPNERKVNAPGDKPTSGTAHSSAEFVGFGG
jgi:hypothetical protein